MTLRAALPILALMMSPALAQNSFPTTGGQTVAAMVVMCIAGGRAVLCSGAAVGSDARFPTAAGQAVSGGVRMCLIAGQAIPC